MGWVTLELEKKGSRITSLWPHLLERVSPTSSTWRVSRGGMLSLPSASVLYWLDI